MTHTVAEDAERGAAPTPWWRATNVCATTPTERIFRVVAAVALGAFGLSQWPTAWWCALPATICSVFLLIGAITGWCPTQLLQGVPGRRRTRTTNSLGFPEMTGVIDVGAPRSPQAERSR